jgi:hypothetical protein
MHKPEDGYIINKSEKDSRVLKREDEPNIWNERDCALIFSVAQVWSKYDCALIFSVAQVWSERDCALIVSVAQVWSRCDCALMFSVPKFEMNVIVL